MLHYILQTILFQLFFLLAYEVLLKKETFFTTNRWYLLLTPMISFVLPLLKFEVLGTLVPTESFVMLPEVYIGGTANPIETSEGTVTASESFQINWWWIAYSAGFAVSLLFFISKYRILRSLFQYDTIAKDKNLQIIQVPDSNLACTFFSTIFIGDQLREEEITQILSHEKVHVKQKHSIDLLFFELLKILFWFNPLIYVYQSRISMLHEFIADARVAETVDKKMYCQQLLNTAFSTQNISFINQFFNHSLIKKRIIMLQKSRSKRYATFKYLVLVPLILGMLAFISSTNVIAQSQQAFNVPIDAIGNKAEAEEHGSDISPDEALKERSDEALLQTERKKKLGTSKNTMTASMRRKSTENGKKELSDDQQTSTNVPYAIVEEVPIHPSCKNLQTNEERKKCLTENVTRYINTNFNTGLAKEIGLTGIVRTYVRFKISTSGEVVDVEARGPRPELIEEAERVVKGLPKMTPGKQKGKEVAVLYSVPITINVPGK